MSRTRTLVVVAHPDLRGSRVTAHLADAIRDLEHVTVHDITAAYPDGRVDVAREQQLLRDHDTVVWQFPWHWYSVPGVLKSWMDQVLTHGFAYGAGGTALQGKTLRLVTSTGGPADSYAAGGYNRFTVAELLAPLDATAHLTGMRLAEPLVLYGARTVSDEDLALHTKRYREVLAA
ncbi:NAD(P)H-dependent oxidoreductase [Streptomyces tropicalis]|uniref:NAD(P)H-dependent oxidoreductase n=1 Tax=Streptomyces tropicalis TaxID=3034234 RepID=A0ABT6AB50_9ACTN|nr:NAD(P)H-dependent oxidoreductase [Streptomyces tropicalis]MDF3301040.1 NAD(P)H-dependent oxidoreductase [Streptomyces tropicalis]